MHAGEEGQPAWPQLFRTIFANGCSLQLTAGCRAAGGPTFWGSAASAIRWNDRRRREGHFDPKALGGDRRSGRIEAHGELILSLADETPDITLGDLRARLAEQGTGLAISTLWRFFKRRGITRKKRQRILPSRTGRTS